MSSSYSTSIASSSFSMDSKTSWPDEVKRITWPASGEKFIFSGRYLVRAKLELWLHTVFEPRKTKFAHYKDHYYVMAPRKPTKKEARWLNDPDRRAGIEVEGVGYIALPQ